MKFEREVHEQYQKAYALAIANQTKNKKQGLPVCPVALNDLLNEKMISYRVDLGVLEIPTNLIVGVYEPNEDISLYTKEFLPVSRPNSDHAEGWRRVCSDLLRKTGKYDSIDCVEYLGKFYVSDGLKWVSVAKSLAITEMCAHVIRIMPSKTDSKEVELYYDFLFQLRLTGLYQLQFTKSGHYELFQRALGKSPAAKWDDNDRMKFLKFWPSVEAAFYKSFADYLSITAADALVVLLGKYTLDQISRMDVWVLARVFQASWKEIYAISCSEPSVVEAVVSTPKLQTA